MPFSIVDNAAWRALFQWLNCKAKLPSRQTITRHVTELHDSLQRQAHKAFSSATTKCSLQTDVWTAGSGQLSFTGGNISWIDKDWRLRTEFAFLTPLRERHTGANLAVHLYDWVKTRELGQKIVSITTDNASNNNTMLESFAGHTDISFNRSEDHIFCSCHCIGRVVFVFMKSLGCTIPSLRQPELTVPAILVNDTQPVAHHESQSSSSEEREDQETWDDFDPEQQEPDSDGEEPAIFGTSSPHGTSAAMARKFAGITMRSAYHVAEFKKLSARGNALKRVAGIRWANDIEVWESMLAHEETVLKMLDRHADHYQRKHGIQLAYSDFNNLKKLIDIMSPLRKYTRQMEGDKPTGSLVICMWLRLSAHLGQMKSKYAGAEDLVSALEAAIEKVRRYQLLAVRSRPLVIATTLNPLFRPRFFQQHVELGVNETIVKMALLTLCLEQREDNEEDSSVQEESRSLEEEDFAAFGSYETGREVNESRTRALLEEEISRFNNLVGVEPGSYPLRMDPLKWWQRNNTAFPNLAVIARQYLSVLGAQAVTERLFSASAAVCNPRRMGNFLPETISAQVGADQLMRGGYQAHGPWAEAQDIIDNYHSA